MHRKGDTLEFFGRERMDNVIKAVFNKGCYRLVRSHAPTENEDLDFDFSECAGTAKDAVLALVAVEKVYRMIPDPSAGPDDRITVDIKVVESLQAAFLARNRTPESAGLHYV
jgi:hypothetical protein